MKSDEYGVLICNFCGTRRKSQLTRLEYYCYKCGEPIVDAVVRSKKQDEEREAKRKEREASLRYIMTGEQTYSPPTHGHPMYHEGMREDDAY